MAEFGWLSLRCVSASVQPDMDYCARLSSSQATSKTYPHSGQSSTGPRASSCLSSTMVGNTDPDDSGSSRPPTPTRTTAESNQSVTRDSPLLRHELELSISSLNDAQRSSSGGGGGLASVKNEFDPTSASITRKDITGRLGGGGGSVGVDDETSFFGGPPRKRARMSPSGFRLEEAPAGKVREELQRHPSLAVSLSVSSDVTGPPHTLVASRSLPSYRLAESDPSPSRGASGPGSSNATMSWWLGTGAKVSSNPSEGLQYPTVSGSARTNFGIDGRGLIPGTTLQERDFLCKQTSFFPNVLSTVETSDHHLRRGGGIGPENLPISSTVGVKAPGGGQEQKLHGGHSQYFLNDPLEHPFFQQRTETSTSRTSNISTVSEETIPRSGNPVFSGGKIREPFRESLPPQEASSVYGQQMNQRPFEAGKRRNSAVPESQLRLHERDVAPLHGFPRSHQQLEQRTMVGGPGGNANTTFYARIRDAAQQPTSSNSFPSQAVAGGGGFSGAFNVNNSGLGFNVGVQSLPRASSAQMGPGGPVHFVGEPASSSAVTQVGGSDILRNFGGNPGMGPISPFSTQVQNPEHIRSRNSQDFLQTLQQQQHKQPFSSEGGERYRLSPSSGQVGRGPGAGPGQGHQDFPFLSSQPSQQTFSVELNPPPRGSNNVQTSSGLRDFLSPPAPKGVDLSYGGGSGRSPRIGSQTFSGVPTQLSLQAPATSGLLVLMEGRSIGRRIGLQDYDGYDSFAAAMRTMFISQISTQDSRAHGEINTLANAIPGYVIAYEDEEGDILLAGDLPWREFVRVAKQIRIVSSSRISFKPPAGKDCSIKPASGIQMFLRCEYKLPV